MLERALKNRDESKPRPDYCSSPEGRYLAGRLRGVTLGHERACGMRHQRGDPLLMVGPCRRLRHRHRKVTRFKRPEGHFGISKTWTGSWDLASSSPWHGSCGMSHAPFADPAPLLFSARCPPQKLPWAETWGKNITRSDFLRGGACRISGPMQFSGGISTSHRGLFPLLEDSHNFSRPIVDEQT
jgi:hypothetical protein